MLILPLYPKYLVQICSQFHQSLHLASLTLFSQFCFSSTSKLTWGHIGQSTSKDWNFTVHKIFANDGFNPYRWWVSSIHPFITNTLETSSEFQKKGALSGVVMKYKQEDVKPIAKKKQWQALQIVNSCILFFLINDISAKRMVSSMPPSACAFSSHILAFPLAGKVEYLP